MEAWYELYKKRLGIELDALNELNVHAEVDKEAMALKIVRLRLLIDGNNPNFDLPEKKPVKLTAVYPDNFPFFRPTVFAYELNLPRHQNPIEKNLCLIPRDTYYWYPSSTLASFLKEQLSKLLVQGNITDTEILGKDPDEQAEPISEYYPHYNTPVIFDPSVLDVNFDDGQFTFLGKIRVGIPEDAEIPTRSAVLETRDDRGKLISRLPESLYSIFSKIVGGVLYKLPHQPPFEDAAKNFLWLKDTLKEKGQKIPFDGPMPKVHGEEIKNIIGLCFPEETAADKTGVGWLFITVVMGKEKIENKKAAATFAPKPYAYYSKISRINKDAITIRIPKLKALSEKTIAVIGLGALGAPAAIEFAKNGVKELRLMDFDIVEAGTTVRWPLGISIAGLYKTKVLKNFIESNYPFTKVVIENWVIGATRITGDSIDTKNLDSERPLLDKFLDDVSILYDATAEQGITHFLSYEADRRKIPFVSIYATQGALGGMVLRVVPGKNEGCWMCIRLAMDDHTIKEPPADSFGKIQAPGCGNTSFTGAGFDLQNISLGGVRMAMGILCEGDESGYPTLEENAAVLSLADTNNKAIFPKWTAYNIPKNPNCPYCGQE